MQLCRFSKVDGVGDITARLYEYNLDSPYDINSLSLLNDPKEIVRMQGYHYLTHCLEQIAQEV